MRHPNRSEQQAKIVVDLGDRAHGGAGTAAGGLLLDRDGGAKSINCIDIRAFHLIQKLPRVGRKRLHIAALALGINRVKGERRLARPAQSGHHGERVAGNLDVDVFQIVLPCATDRNLRNRHLVWSNCPSVTSTGNQNCLKVEVHSSTPYLSCHYRRASTQVEWSRSLVVSR